MKTDLVTVSAAGLLIALSLATGAVGAKLGTLKQRVYLNAKHDGDTVLDLPDGTNCGMGSDTYDLASSTSPESVPLRKSTSRQAFHFSSIFCEPESFRERISAAVGYLLLTASTISLKVYGRPAASNCNDT